MVTIDDLLDGCLTFFQATLGPSAGFDYFKETMDLAEARRKQVTILHEGGRSSGRSVVDELDFSIVVVAPAYADARAAAFALYTALHNLFDVLAGGANAGQNGFWLVQPPRRLPMVDVALEGLNFYLLEAKTWADVRS